MRIALLLLIGAAWTQSPSASVVGRVTDPSAAVVSGVTITITNVETNISQTGVSNMSGDFTMPYLNPGRYALAATATGFQTHLRREFLLEVNQVLRLDVALKVGAANETVTVNDVPPALNTETGTRGEVTTQSEIKEMPLAGRNPPIEGVQEFKMLTSGFAAENGRYAGGMLSVVTKSGIPAAFASPKIGRCRCGLRLLIYPTIRTLICRRINVDISTAGAITRAKNSRNLQIGLRLEF